MTVPKPFYFFFSSVVFYSGQISNGLKAEDICLNVPCPGRLSPPLGTYVAPFFNCQSAKSESNWFWTFSIISLSFYIFFSPGRLHFPTSWSIRLKLFCLLIFSREQNKIFLKTIFLDFKSIFVLKQRSTNDSVRLSLATKQFLWKNRKRQNETAINIVPPAQTNSKPKSKLKKRK